MDRKEIEKTFCEIADELIFKMKKELIEEASKRFDEKEKELAERKRDLSRAQLAVEKYGLSCVKFEYNGETYSASSILEEAKKARRIGKPVIRPHLYVLIEPEKKYVYVGIIEVSAHYDMDWLKKEVIMEIEDERKRVEDELMELTLASVANKEKVKELLILQEAFNRVCKI